MTETKAMNVERTHQKRAAKPRPNRTPCVMASTRAIHARRRSATWMPGPRRIQDEKNLLRIKIRRLARLIPLKKIDAKELEALIKLIRVVAVLDALERTGISARKVDGSGESAARRPGRDGSGRHVGGDMESTPLERHRELRDRARSLAVFARGLQDIKLRPYQLEAAQAVIDSIRERAGRSIVVMFSRQSGKDELSANLKAYLLTRQAQAGGRHRRGQPDLQAADHQRHPAAGGTAATQSADAAGLAQALGLHADGGPRQGHVPFR